jgi:phosphoketolase
MPNPTAPEMLEKMDAYWRAANYLVEPGVNP